ncbi:hypothetical protein [Streptomyces indicus]|uniref:Lipoprotein n=1 Tax=Streptomyces indicus TaxID=417292 RepID=A0A1G8WM95_9ACTN|nr:hypothetical protein [Streptomyces indicus]SDJ79183.1 hypothetical protein SAMN05421806_102545 [Streptomyces indicus]
MRVIRKSSRVTVLGALALAALLTTTACQPGEEDGKADGSKPSATATEKPEQSEKPEQPEQGDKTDKPSKPAGDKTGTAAPEGSGGSGDGKGGVNPADNVCAENGQGPYGKIETLTFGGEAPNTVVGLVLGHYECQGGETEPQFKPDSATGAAMNVLLDDAKLKVVVEGDLAKRMGSSTPDANTFVKEMAELESEGKLVGQKAPQFYFQSDAPNPDAPDGEDTKIVYLHQITFHISN